MQRQQAAIFDLDGSYADVSAARHHVQQRPKNFKAFHTYACTEAPVIENTLVLARAMTVLGVKVLLVSGRHNRWRVRTQLWMQKRQAPFDALFMRADDDFRPDTEVKLEIYKEHIEPFYEVVLAVDDRPSVVELWRSLGINTYVVPGWTEAEGA